MENQIIQQKLLAYKSKSPANEDSALKEISQEIVLAALSQTNFFLNAAFQGGTCLRILYGLPRFSEDLDFVLKKAEKFSWEFYLEKIRTEFETYGLQVSTKSRNTADKIIKQAFIKEESFGQQLNILFERQNHHKKIKIKLEIDTNPPEGSTYELKYLSFPFPYSIEAQDLPSLFASKCHTLLCRPYPKGRDWYNLIWYINQQISPNLDLLAHALKQMGPYKNLSKKDITHKWLVTSLQEKIKDLNMKELNQDVRRFIKPAELTGLNNWNPDFFCALVEKLA